MCLRVFLKLTSASKTWVRQTALPNVDGPQQISSRSELGLPYNKSLSLYIYILLVLLLWRTLTHHPIRPFQNSPPSHTHLSTLILKIFWRSIKIQVPETPRFYSLLLLSPLLRAYYTVSIMNWGMNKINLFPPNCSQVTEDASRYN